MQYFSVSGPPRPPGHPPQMNQPGGIPPPHNLPPPPSQTLPPSGPPPVPVNPGPQTMMNMGFESHSAAPMMAPPSFASHGPPAREYISLMLVI